MSSASESAPDSTQLMPLRKQIARQLIDLEVDPTIDYAPPQIFPEMLAAAPRRRRPRVPPVAWPTADLAPKPVNLDPEPQPEDPLPEADWLVMTWTRAEHEALKSVFTPTIPVQRWHPYRHEFESYIPDIRVGAPALRSNRIGSYYMVKLEDIRVLLLKSEFHLNQDGVKLPLRRLTRQLIDETKASTILSIGTAGGVANADELGDVVVSQSAKYRLNDEFKNEPFNGKSYTSRWSMKNKYFKDATKLMIPLQEPPYAPPTKRIPFKGRPVVLPPNKPNIRPFDTHPIITTDYFEFGTSDNRLDKIGCAVEMDDAVIAMVCEETDDKPRYAFVRNVSDPVINAELDERMQIMWAVWFYEQYGLQTSYNGALATWAVIASN
jgi:nucleoside phosphorylase